ncbi:hypothetical protein EEL31_04620 [Brevibacillus laterosporus]|nr:hypothetical protein [Brevibacillus laterosporus]TPG67917.1 hypothetical protein EEL31_04620 [Brevibacillus laterosporus]
MTKLDLHTIISDQQIFDTKATIDLQLLVKILSGYATMQEETKKLMKKNKALSVNNEHLNNELQDLYEQIKHAEIAAYHKNQSGKDSRSEDHNELWMKHDQFFWGFFDKRE